MSATVRRLGFAAGSPERIDRARSEFVFATTPDEGLGIALIEAMAAGVPVVASDVGACREVLDDGALGLLVPPGDPVALADAIERVRDDPRRGRTRGAGAPQGLRGVRRRAHGGRLCRGARSRGGRRGSALQAA